MKSLISELPKNREGFYVGDYDRECTKCGSIFFITSPTITLCHSCNNLRVKNEDPNKKMLRRAKARAKERGMSFDIDLDDILIPTHCPILGMPLQSVVGRSGGGPNSPTLDRKDNAKGYVKGNVWVISSLANMMKSSATPLELFRFGTWALRTYHYTTT